MPISEVSLSLAFLDVERMRQALNNNPSDIHYCDKHGASLLHALVSNFRHDGNYSSEKLSKSWEMLDVLFEHGIDPTVRAYRNSLTAKEAAEKSKCPEKLITALADYEEQWQAKHSTSTAAQVAHLRHRNTTKSDAEPVFNADVLNIHIQQNTFS